MADNPHERPYVVLRRNAGKKPIYEHIDTVDARNSEHAKRVVFKTMKGASAFLVAVPEKMWSEGPVEKNTRETVTVG